MTTTDGLPRGGAAHDTGAPDHRPGRRSDPGPRLRRPGQADRRQGRRHLPDQPPDPPQGPGVRRAVHRGRGLRDRPQGHRPHLPVPEGRQDRDLRRGRRRQDRHHPGADPERRPGARGRLRVRRRRRAVARGQRPHPRDDRVGRHRQDGLRVRPDERAAGRPSARGPHRPDDGRVLPRRGGPGRPPVHRQHLPVHPGRLGGIRAPRPDAVRGRLPAEPRDRDGGPPGADHLDQDRARSRPSRPSSFPRTTTRTRRRPRRSATSTRRSASSGASPSWASTRRSIR